MPFLFLAATLHAKPLELSVNAEAAILMNAQTGKVLFEKNAYGQAYPASTTKIATALYALYKYSDRLEDILTADREAVASITPQAKKQSNYRSPPHWLETDGTHVGIKRGEEIKLYDLLHLMMIASANDAANVIAQGLGGSISKFMEGENEFLKQIGCSNTNYNNPHGLHHPQHVTTAYDLALMAKEAMKYPLFCQIVSLSRYTSPQTNLEPERHILQGNHLLRKGPFYYPKAIGIKTGFTSTSGKNLVAAAQNEERVLIAVALGYRGPRSELYHDMIKMFDTAFSEPKLCRTLLPSGEQKVMAHVPGATQPLKTTLSESLIYNFYASEEAPVKVAVKWEIPPLPITAGTVVGKIQIIDIQGNVIKQAPLLAAEELKANLTHSFGRLLTHNHLGRKVAFGGGAALVLFIAWRMRLRRKTLS